MAAVALGMSDVRAYIGRGESETGISINGETVYLFPLIREETPEAMLQRRVTVTFAGPAWETHSDPKFRTRSFHLRAQKVDCLKARELIRRARRECGLRGAALADWLEESWEDAAGMIESEIDAILAVAEALDQLKTLDDAAIRVLIQDAGGGFPAPGCPKSPGAGPAAK